MITEISFPEIVGPNGIFSDGDWVESKDQNPDGSTRLLQLADIGIGEFLDKSNRFMTNEAAARLKCTFLRKGDILIARMPDPIGRACIFPGDAKPCVTVVDVCVVRPDPKITDPKWLVHFINSSACSRQIDKWITGTTRQRISRGNLSKVVIPLPPLEEQKRIAAILDKADAIRKKRQQAIELADQFLKSVFLDMFGDPVTNPKEIKLSAMTDVFDITTGKLDSNAAVAGGQYPFFTCAKEVSAIDDFAFDVEALLLAGNNANADYDVKHYAGKFNAYQRTYVLTLKDEDWQYGFFQFALEYQLQNLKRSSKGSNTKYITLEIMSRTYLPVPTPEQQKEFIKHFHFVRNMKDRLFAAEELVSHLTASLTQSAFQGGLQSDRVA